MLTSCHVMSDLCGWLMFPLGFYSFANLVRKQAVALQSTTALWTLSVGNSIKSSVYTKVIGMARED
jgi:uncharacterized protein involved in response to NO